MDGVVAGEMTGLPPCESMINNARQMESLHAPNRQQPLLSLSNLAIRDGLRLAWKGRQDAAYPAAGPTLRLLSVCSAAGVHADDNAPGALMPLQSLPHNACMHKACCTIL